MPPAKWRVLAKSHHDRNLAEYEGQTEIDPRLLTELIQVATELETLVAALPVPPP